MDTSHLRTPAGKQRARGVGVPFDGRPGANNAITDVAGVEVGYTTLIQGEGALEIGRGPVRTGVTAILPRGREAATTPVFAGCHSLNGNGEMSGFIWIEEAGRFSGPVTITNTHSCGIARDATIRWQAERFPESFADTFGLPVAAETYDGYLNDINGFHVTAEHVFQAIDEARGGAIEEGGVGGGTGMICYEFKGGSGTASRLVDYDGREFAVGAFVQANFGIRHQLTIAGVPVGRHLTEGTFRKRDTGSVIGVVATDAPLLPHQLKRLARRAGLGIGRSGAVSGHGSGDIFLAFSTANTGTLTATTALRTAAFIDDGNLDPLFEAVVQAIDESVVNSMVANETMRGRDDHEVLALPREPLRALLKRYRRM
jgi:D-aminopeptidase